MTVYRIVHTTRYDFEAPTESCSLEARMRVRDLAYQTCRFHQLVVRPLSGPQSCTRDASGNWVTVFDVPTAHSHLEVSAINVVACSRAKPPALDAGPSWEEVRKASSDGSLRHCVDATALTECSPELEAYVRSSFPAGRSILLGASDLTERIHRDFAYAPGATTVETTASEAARLGRGVCQDFAHVAAACLRSLGLPVRYVSGYLDTSSARVGDAPVVGELSHAWFAVHVPGLGWVDFDPTVGSLVGAGHVTLGWGRDYRDVVPLRGTCGGRHRLRVSVNMVQDAA